MRKFICGLLISILMMNLILVTPVAASIYYVEVTVPSGSTLHIKEGVNTILKTDGETYDIYTRTTGDACFDYSSDVEKIIDKETYVSPSKGYNVKFYLPKSVLGEVEVLNRGIYDELVVKPGEYFSIENTEEKCAVPIINSSGISSHVSSTDTQEWPVDIIKYGVNRYQSSAYKSNNGDIQAYKITKGEKLLFGNSGNFDVTLQVPITHIENIKLFNGPLFTTYDINPGEKFTKVDENYNDKDNSNEFFTIFNKKNKYDIGRSLESIEYNREGKIIDFSSEENIIFGYKTEWVNKGRNPVRFYLSFDFKGTASISKEDKNLIYKVLLSPGESMYYKATENENMRRHYSLPWSCETIYYDDNKYTFMTILPKDYIDEIKGFEIKNTTNVNQIIEIPYVGKNNYRKDFKDIVDVVEFLPGINYNLNGNPKENPKPVSFDFKNIRMNVFKYNKDYSFINNSSEFSLVEVFDKRYRFENRETEVMSLKTRAGDKKFITREEDVDFSGKIDIMDLALVSTRYNYSSKDASLTELYLFDLVGNKYYKNIDLYDLVKVARAIE